MKRRNAPNLKLNIEVSITSEKSVVDAATALVIE